MPRKLNVEDARKKFEKAQRDLRRSLADEKEQSKRTRNHVGIVVGLNLIEHANRNPDSEVRRVIVRTTLHHLTLRPKDRDDFAPLLASWGVALPPVALPAPASETGSPPSPAPDQFDDAAE